MTVDKEQKNLRVFGYGLAVIAAFFGIGGVLKHGLTPAPLILSVCSAIFLSVTALDYKALRPGYRGWMAAAHVIGSVVTALILAAVFFLVFTPVALFLKLAGRDHLDRKLNRACESYWIKRTQTLFQKERYREQF